MFGNNGSRIASRIIGFLPTGRMHAFKRFLLRVIGGMEIGDGTCIWSGAKFTGRYIKIGKNCHIGTGCEFVGLTPMANIVIGDEVSFGPQVYVSVGTHDIGAAKRRSGKGRMYPIAIGDGAAISVRAIIMPNVKVGNGAFVGPGVVVSSNIKPNTMISPGRTRVLPLPDDGIAWE